MLEPIAHIDESGRRHNLSEHLRSTSSLARKFGDTFQSGGWCSMAGLWHDLGKYSKKFQKKLLQNHDIRVDHSTAGAQYAYKVFDKSPQGVILAYLIAGHHAGLPDWSETDARKGALEYRLKTKRIEPWKSGVPDDILEPKIELENPKRSDPALWVRMLFSSLVDADFIDTEAFFDQKRSSLRGQYPSLRELINLFESFMQKMVENAPKTPLNIIRRKIYEYAMKNAKLKPGIYTMTVPTGGGKTLSSMAFALHHALKFGKKRIIYVIPYTRIIEQTANIYRSIFGNTVIEHHSQFDIESQEEDLYACERNKLATENWDAPIIVTTSVQFFESAFGSKTSRCRKLHNIAESVVVIDEVQTLPSDYLQPIVKKIDAFSKDFGTTFLLCTATQPKFASFETIESRFEGLQVDGEIAPDPLELARKLRRTRIIWKTDARWSIDELSKRLANEKEAVMAIVNTRERARNIYEKLGDDSIHLSANMCGAHRMKVLQKIKEKLAKKEKFILVSTNLVEAGVDIDFPKVYREIAGLDSIAQAAGRCNREGKREISDVIVFSLDLKEPLYLSTPIMALENVLPSIDDILSPESFELYFENYYKLVGERLDRKKILDRENRLGRWPFKQISKDFKMIEDDYTVSVIVPYAQGEKIIRSVENGYVDRNLLRRAQRFTVTIPQRICDTLLQSGEISSSKSGVFMLKNGNLYTEDIGFDVRKAGIWDTDELIL